MHHKDAPSVPSLLLSIEKNVPCYNSLVVVVPPESRHVLAGLFPSGTKLFVVPEPLPKQFGYLSQQVVKLYADRFTTAANVLILEADMVFTGWRDKCFFAEGRQRVRTFCVGYARDKADDIWKRGTEHAVGGVVDQDCVVNTPFAFPRAVFPALREHLKRRHGKPFGKLMEDYFPGHSKGWERTDLLFSEFNILAHFMLQHRPELTELVRTGEPGWHDIGKCSQHIGAVVKRNHDLPNPKLTHEYFELALRALDGPVPAEEAVLELQ
mmetsp:Transcript_9015/g.28625  ORF Transcript_9015/g.28625 Transcript_9015/m.28625 type:complete len:267 (-) Transcript_9015:104-904(-)